MKTLQEEYNLIKEGKGRKDLFMKQALRQFPQFITKFNTFEEVSSILRGKQVISESIGGVTTGRPNPFSNWAQFLNEEAKAVEKNPTKEVTSMETRGFDYKDKKNIDNVYGQEFLEGYYAEMNDPKNANKTVDQLKEIVAKNMSKDMNYYMKNAAFGVKGIGYTDDVPGLRASKTDQMTPVKLKENMIKLVDLLNENLSGYVDIIPSGLGATYKVSEAEDKKEEEDRMRDAEKDDAAHIEDLEKDMKDDKKEDDKMKKEGLEHRLKEIEAAGNVAALEAKMNAIDEEMTARQAKLDMVSENEAIAEFINPTRIKEIQKEIKALEGAKTKYGKMYEKMTGKAYTKQVVDETDELGY